MQTAQKQENFEILQIRKIHADHGSVFWKRVCYSIYLSQSRDFRAEFADNTNEIFQKGAEHYVQKNRSVYQEQRRRAYRREPCVHGGEVPVQPPELPQNEHRESVPNDRHAYGRVLINNRIIVPPAQMLYIAQEVLFCVHYRYHRLKTDTPALIIRM